MTTVTSEKLRPSFQFVVTTVPAHARVIGLSIMRCLCTVGINQRGGVRVVAGQYSHQLAGRIDKGGLVGEVQKFDRRGYVLV